MIEIDGRLIGPGEPPYVIAEISANHGGKLEAALQLVDVAKAAGSDAVKLQTYRPDTITLDAGSDEFRIRGGPWDGRRLYDLYQEAHTPWEWHGPIFDHARSLGITVFSSPFDQSAADLLEDLDAPAYKIASFEAVDLPLIRYIASKGRPMVISTGMADAVEIAEAIHAAEQGGCSEIALLHCVSGYPAPSSDYNLKTLPDMIERFGKVTGLSDHTLDNTTAIAAVALGASLIEKHVTLDRSIGSPDDSFSLEPDELVELCRAARTAWEALGRADYDLKSSEAGNIMFRRSLYFVEDLPAGSLIQESSVRSVRPGFGLPPKFRDDVVGRTVVRDVSASRPVRREDFE